MRRNPTLPSVAGWPVSPPQPDPLLGLTVYLLVGIIGMMIVERSTDHWHVVNALEFIAGSSLV
jgi:hypothetical protein